MATGLISTVNPATNAHALQTSAVNTAKAVPLAQTSNVQPAIDAQNTAVKSAATSLPGVQAAAATKPLPAPVPAGAQSLSTPKNNLGPQSQSPQAPTAAPRTVGADETVAGQLNTLLNQNSSYMQSARNSSLEQANQRGLINSSIAVGSGQRAAIDAAMPIAQQDATTHATAAQSAQEANQNYGLSGYNAQLNSKQASENFGYNSQLAEQNAKSTYDLQTKLKQMDVNLDMTKLSSQEKQNFSTSASPIIQQAESEISNIQRTPDEQMSPADKAKAINDLNTSLQARLNTLGSIYGYKLSWNAPSVSAAAPPPGLIASGAPGANNTGANNTGANATGNDPNYISA